MSKQKKDDVYSSRNREGRRPDPRDDLSEHRRTSDYLRELDDDLDDEDATEPEPGADEEE
jgi:hypothetical protein